jgi:hypothetical protein
MGVERYTGLVDTDTGGVSCAALQRRENDAPLQCLAHLDRYGVGMKAVRPLGEDSVVMIPEPTYGLVLTKLQFVDGLKRHKAWKRRQVQAEREAEAAFDRPANGVVGADEFVGMMPAAEGFFRDGDMETAGEVADGITGRVAEVVAADCFHNNLDWIWGVFSHQVGEGVPAAIAAPALALLMAGFARAFLDHVFGATLGAAGDGRIGGREDNHNDISVVNALVVRDDRWMIKGIRLIAMPSVV